MIGVIDQMDLSVDVTKTLRNLLGESRICDNKIDKTLHYISTLHVRKSHHNMTEWEPLIVIYNAIWQSRNL